MNNCCYEYLFAFFARYTKRTGGKEREPSNARCIWHLFSSSSFRVIIHAPHTTETYFLFHLYLRLSVAKGGECCLLLEKFLERDPVDSLLVLISMASLRELKFAQARDVSSEF